MQRISQNVFDRITLNASLQRLGIVELEERLEFSPLLLEGDLAATSRAIPDGCCLCKFPGGDPWPDGIHVGDPATDGLGTTGTTNGRPL
jgi:hypothetical protein